MNEIKKYVLTAYRWISFTTLVGLFFGIIWYAVGFILMAGGLSNWTIPIKLSPSQERVLQFQPQVATLESSVLRQHVERDAAQSKVTVGKQQLHEIDVLLTRINGAQKVESSALNSVNTSIAAVLKDKTFDIAETTKLIDDTKALMRNVNEEEAAHLITKDQASQRRLALQASYNQATDAKAQYIALQEQQRQGHAAASTLTGGGTSLVALQSLESEQMLILTRAQLAIDVQTAIDTVVAIDTNLSELERVLDTAKQAPQYRALRETVYVLFAPYTSIDDMKIGDPVYSCYLMYVGCYKVGTVKKLYESEEYAHHPFLKTDLKGRLVNVEYDKNEMDANESQILFVGRKPLLL